jgi:flagellar assembly factor FliW
MEILTEIFGKIEVSQEQSVFFADGLDKVSKVKDYVLLPVSEEEILYCLQAKDYPEISFFLIDPFVAVKDFRLQIQTESLQAMGCNGDVLPDEVIVLCPFIKGNQPGDFSVDFMSPILINREKHIGLQIKNNWKPMG